MSVPDIQSLTINGAGVQVSPTGTVPYIAKEERPLFRWSASDADGQALEFDLSCWWYGRRSVDGDPLITPVLMFSKTSLTSFQYRPREDEKLEYIDSDDAGGDYYVTLVARDTDTDETTMSGYFRVNQPPNVPTGLRVI